MTAPSFPGARPTSVPGPPRPPRPPRPPPPTTASSARPPAPVAPVPDPGRTQRARVQMVQHTVERAAGAVYLRSSCCTGTDTGTGTGSSTGTGTGAGTDASSKYAGPSPSSRSRAAGPSSSLGWWLQPHYYYYYYAAAPVVLAGIVIALAVPASTSTSTSTNPHALIANMATITGNCPLALGPATCALVGALVVILWLVGGRVQHQSLTPLPGLGIQLATTRRVMSFGTSTQRLFVPLEDIATVVIHERLARWSAEYYLAIVRRGGDVVVAFDEIRPRLDILRDVYHATREALWDEYSDTPHNGYLATTTPHNGHLATATLHR